MSLSSKLKSLRAKPQHVRERMLIIALAVVVPVIVAGGVIAFIYEHDTTPHEQVIDLKAIGAYFSDSAQGAKGIVSGVASVSASGSDGTATQ